MKNHRNTKYNNSKVKVPLVLTKYRHNVQDWEVFCPIHVLDSDT